MSKYDSVYSVLQKPVAEHQRNVFPLENAHSYSMRAGQITPIKAFHYKPKDYLKMKVSDFSITFPMNTAPFLRGRKEFAFYNVYYNSVWSLFNQFMATRNDSKTSVFGQTPDLQNEPRIPLIQLYSAVVQQWLGYINFYYYVQFFAQSNSPSVYGPVRDAWLLGQKTGSKYALAFMQSLFVILSTPADFPPVFWNAINVDFGGNLPPSGETNADIYFDVVRQWRWSSYCRKLDMFGYGNIYPLLRACENYISNQITNCDFSNVSDIQQTEDRCTDRICAMIKSVICSCTKFTGTFGNPSNVVFRNLNLYPICSYNSIFYHFFRNSYFDLTYWVRDYNLDFVQNLYASNLCDLNHFSRRFLDLEYHQWKKDKFTAILPDQQFGAVSSLSFSTLGAVDSNARLLRAYSLQNGNIDSFDVSSGNIVKSYQGTSSSPLSLRSDAFSGEFDIFALKRAEMLQDYRQTLMRAGNKTTDVFRALYGTAPSSEHVEDIIPQFLDTFGEDIFIDPVTATAETGQGSQGNLGDLSARGKFSGQSGNITFNAGGNFGCIICLAYVVPTAEYNSYMIDQHLAELTPEQHFIPQFENLGLEDIYSDELNCLRDMNQLAARGKVPRYHHKKSEVDVVHGAFCSLQIYDDWSGNLYYEKFYGDFNHWVSPRTDMQSQTHLRLRDLYINPSVLDNVFVQNAGADLSQDQFLCRTYFDLTSTKEMSKVGLVNFV